MVFLFPCQTDPLAGRKVAGFISSCRDTVKYGWPNSQKGQGPRPAKQFAEKLGRDASGAEALEEEKGLIAALKALHHPKSSLSANCKAVRPGRVGGTAKTGC